MKLLKNKKYLPVLLAPVVLAGCATNSDYYAAVAEANAQQAKIEQIKADKETARIEGLIELAKTGSEADRASATIALALAGRYNESSSESNFTVPRQGRSEALEWASVLLPFTGQLTSAYFGYSLGKAQSDNKAEIAMLKSDNQTSASMSRDEAFTELGIGEFREKNSARYMPEDAYDLGDNKTELEIERLNSELEGQRIHSEVEIERLQSEQSE